MGMDIQLAEPSEFIQTMKTWQDNDFNVMTAIRLFDTADGGVLIGISDFHNQHRVLVTSELSQGFADCKSAFAAIGALFDAYFASQTEKTSTQ